MSKQRRQEANAIKRRQEPAQQRVTPGQPRVAIAPPESAPARNPNTLLNALHFMAFLLFAAVVGARPLIPESWEVVDLGIFGDTSVRSTPFHSVVLDALLLTSAVLLYITSLQRKLSWPLIAALTLFGLAAGISGAGAHEKRMALAGSASLLIFATAIAVAASSLNFAWMGRLLLAVGIAAAGSNAYKCIAQRG